MNISLVFIQELSSYHDQILDIKQVNNKSILVCTNSDYIKHYDVTTKQLKFLYGHKDLVTCCDFFRDTMVTGSKDGKLFVWKFNTEQNQFEIIKKYKAHSEAIAGLSMGRKTAQVFISADLAGEIKIWDLE